MAKIEQDINEALINDVLQIYANAEDKMLKAVAKRVAKGIKTEGWNENKLKEVQSLHKEIESILGNTKKLSETKVSEGIIQAYKSGVQEVEGGKTIHSTILDEVNVPMNLKMQILATNNLLSNASFQVLRKADDAYQKVMAHATTGLLSGVDTRIQATQKMLNEFASKGITTFVDKAGRNWDLGSYAEMCARTVGSHAALQGHIDRQLEVGEDLVKVSKIGTTCPICQRWQGVVLSISGNSPKYHSIEDAKANGLFHPNCKHTIVMHIPELDGEGKIEPDPISMNTISSKRNKLIEQQRANERQIRYWKKRKALAITPEEQKKCNEKIKAWQYKNLIHCEKNGLRRQYAREGVMVGHKSGPVGAMIGGHLKEYEELYKDVVGEEPKKVFKKLKMNLQLFAEKKYDKWLKEEIQSLDELDVDKAMMKDASNKAVTPTSLYKKYIGDNPGQDYAEVSEYEKGAKEYKSGYAKWLKQQIEEIGVSYKVKPQYTETHEEIPDEDKALSATEFYKKYHDGEKPTDAYKKLGGEEGTGVKYSKWVEDQKRALIKSGITKTIPFENATTQKTVDTISSASEVVSEAKKFIEDKAKEKEEEKKKSEIEKHQKKVKEIIESDAHYFTKSEVLEKGIKSTIDNEEVVKIYYEGFKELLSNERKKELDEDYLSRLDISELEENIGMARGRIEAGKKAIVSGKLKKDKVLIEQLYIENKEEEIKILSSEIERRKVKINEEDEKIKKLETKPSSSKNELDKETESVDKKAIKKAIKKDTKKRGNTTRDKGASVLNDLTNHYNESEVKNKANQMIDNIAEKSGYSSEKVKEMIDKDLAKVLEEGEFGITMPLSALKKVLSTNANQSGFKNLFEIGDGGGCTDPNIRCDAENKVFGFKGKKKDFEQNKEDRPVYGLVLPKFSDDTVDYYKTGPASWYGDGIVVTFDKSMSENVSFTIGDSLDWNESVVGCEVTNPEFRGGHDNFEKGYIKLLQERKEGKENSEDPNYLLTEICKKDCQYIELQFHGDKTKHEMSKNITHIYINEQYYNDNEIEQLAYLLDELEIEYTVYE